MRRCFTFLILLLALPGCTGPENGARRERPPAAKPTKDQVRALRDDAAGVIVGKVESFEDPPTGRVYVVRVEEVLSLRPASDEQKASHPLAHDSTIKVTTFLFKGGVGGEISPLDELSRYVFFLAPKEAAGEWLNLDDPAPHRLPEAQPTLEALRALRDQPLAPAGAQGRPPR